MASEEQMKNPLFVGKAIRAQLEDEIPKDLPLERDFKEGTDYTITDHIHALHASLSKDPRTLELVTSLITHLHAFARETELTHAEWTRAVELLTRAGKESTQFKNEFVLLSDVLGLSVLLEQVGNPMPDGCTECCEPGPFWTDDAPEVKSGSSLAAEGTVGEWMFFSATIRNLQGKGIKGAKVDMWQADGDGLYDVQYPDRPQVNDRGCIIAEDNGDFCYRGILPVAYPIPSDGPTGDILKALGRHPHRSSHLHFILRAPGYAQLTTALYPAFSPFLGTDPVFATQKSLVCDVVEEKDPKKIQEMGFSGGNRDRVWVWKYDFVLATEEEVAALKAARKAKAKA